jgi:hypothetical protein
LEKHPEKINWKCLSRNPAAMHLLEKNTEKIDWFLLSGNPGAVGECYLEKTHQYLSMFLQKTKRCGFNLLKMNK